jgi:trimethylamine:corrinoid methyltransferase-like protein
MSPPKAELDAIETELADFARSAGGWATFLLTACMFAVTLLVPVFARKLRSLSGLTIDERRHALERMEESGVSLPFLAVKAILCLVHYEHPDAAARIGFDGKCLSGRERT